MGGGLLTGDWAGLREVIGNALRPGGIALTDRALDYCGLPASARVLDVGCGVGASVEHLIGQHRLGAVGLDPAERLLGEGRRRDGRLPLICAAGEHLPIRDGALDAVLAECTLSIVGNLDLVLAEASRVLRIDGKLVVSDLYWRGPPASSRPDRRSEAAGPPRILARDEYAERLALHALRVDLWEDHTEALKQLVFELLMAGPSPGCLWSRDGEHRSGPDLGRLITSRRRLGYFLLVARRSPG